MLKPSLLPVLTLLCTRHSPAAAFIRTTCGFAQVGNRGLVNPKTTDAKGIHLHRPLLTNSEQRFKSTELSMNFSAATVSIEAMKGTLSRRPGLATLMFVFLVLLTKLRNPQTILWPGASIDKDCDAAVPEGSLGCPFIGQNIFVGSKGVYNADYGPFAYLRKHSRKYGNIFKSYSYGMPIVSVSGVDNVKSLLKNEFKKDGIGTFLVGETNLGQILGQEMLLYENDSEKHSKLRRLVASAMTPSAISAAIPSILEAANSQVDKIIESSNNPIKMEDVFDSYTLDIAWKQILGLDLKEEDVPKFHEAVHDWAKGVTSPILLMPFKIPGIMKFTKAGRARRYLERKIDEKISKLERYGPDSSTFSKLFFSTDKDGTTKLTRQQVVENALLLILAGSETSSSTLTCAALFLGLHPNVWEEVKSEQRDIISTFGDDINAEIIEKCVYLDAVIKETLRIQPIETGEFRSVKKTIVIDGKQIPKGWNAFFNVRQTHYNDPSTYQADGSHMDHYKGFKPERWLNESTKPVEWMPFGDGQRRCVGERLANTEMKIFLAILARRIAQFELVNKGDKLQWQTDTIMARPADGVLSSVTPA